MSDKILVAASKTPWMYGMDLGSSFSMSAEERRNALGSHSDEGHLLYMTSPHTRLFIKQLEAALLETTAHL